jgi:hypothetical protein
MKRSVWINGAVLLGVVVISALVASRAENLEDLVFVALLLYAAAGFFIVNLLIAIIQAIRKKEWILHAIMALTTSLALFIIAFLAGRL